MFSFVNNVSKPQTFFGRSLSRLQRTTKTSDKRSSSTKEDKSHVSIAMCGEWRTTFRSLKGIQGLIAINNLCKL